MTVGVLLQLYVLLLVMDGVRVPLVVPVGVRLEVPLGDVLAVTVLDGVRDTVAVLVAEAVRLPVALQVTLGLAVGLGVPVAVAVVEAVAVELGVIVAEVVAVGVADTLAVMVLVGEVVWLPLVVEVEVGVRLADRVLVTDTVRVGVCTAMPSIHRSHIQFGWFGPHTHTHTIAGRVRTMLLMTSADMNIFPRLKTSPFFLARGT